MSVGGIELSVSFSSRVLTDNLFTEARYRFKTTAAFAPLIEDDRVAMELEVHGRTVLRDEFAPPVPTSKWEPDREYTFTRRVYIPAFIDEFSEDFRGTASAVLRVGLVFPPGAAPRSGLAVQERRLTFVPASDTPVMVYLSGWYPPEGEPSDPGASWRWTGKEARVAIDNPGRDALLVIRGEGGPAEAGSRKAAVSVDGRALEEFMIGPEVFERRYSIGRVWLGARKDFVLAITVDRTFVPAKTVPGSKDGRELGLRISLLYFR